MTKEQLEEKLYWYKALLNYVYDGDTITAFELDFGFGFKRIVNRGDNSGIRLRYIDANRLGTPEGRDAAKYLRQFQGQEVYLKSYKDETGKYGRYLFEIFANVHDRYININQEMLNLGLVKTYGDENRNN